MSVVNSYPEHTDSIIGNLGEEEEFSLEEDDPKTIENQGIEANYSTTVVSTNATSQNPNVPLEPTKDFETLSEASRKRHKAVAPSPGNSTRPPRTVKTKVDVGSSLSNLGQH